MSRYIGGIISTFRLVIACSGRLACHMLDFTLLKADTIFNAQCRQESYADVVKQATEGGFL